MRPVPLRQVVSIDREQRNWRDRRYVGLEDIESGTGRLLGDGSITTVKSTSFGFGSQHVLYGRLRPYLNKVLLPEFEGHCSTEIFPLLPGGDLDRRYLWYWLTSADIVHAIDATCTGARMPRANMERVLDLEIPLPSLEYQRRIVSLLDEAFASITTATANAEKNLANARELLRGTIDKQFASETWPRRPLIELAKVFDDGDWIESKDQSPNGIRLIQTGNVGNGLFKDRAEKARYISEATFKRLRCTEIFEGDCLVSRLPDPVGRACLIPDCGERMITAVDCTIVRFGPDTLLPALFCYYSQSSDYAAQVAKLTTGSTRLRISRSNLGTIAIPVPPYGDQSILLAELNELSELVDSFKEAQRQKLSTLIALKQSLLQRAFAGELTGASPKLSMA